MHETTSDFPTERPSRWLLFAALWAAAALGIALYLAIVAGLRGDAPLGCGADSGCGDVLASRWSKLFGVPVSLLAAGVYLLVIVAVSFVLRSGGRPAVDRAWWLLSAAFGMIPLSVLWFVGLQWLDVRAYCPWCLADHALGLLCVSSIWLAARSAGQRLLRGAGVAAGVLGACGLMALQWQFPGETPAVARLPVGVDHDTGPGEDRAVAVLDGKLAFALDEVPHRGSPSAPHVLVVLFDYCCPHCRRTHADLVAGMAKYRGQYALALLPMPLSAECNRGEDETQERFRDSCELARLSLAVWRTQPERFAEFDAWLFEPEWPRTAEAARSEAERLLGADALAEGLSDPWIDQRIAADVEGYIRSEVGTIPVLLSPGMPGMVGRTSTTEELWEILERDLSLLP
ncbi:MAG: vitamin K epoxide reductase family protein [Planctomycetaceae bacterium]